MRFVAIKTAEQLDLLRLFDVINLCRQIQAPQGHAEQEPERRHRAVAKTDAHPTLGQVQLEPADIVRCGGIG